MRRTLLVGAAALSSFACSAASLAQCTATVAQTEGPFYLAGSPETLDLQIRGDGPLLTLNGTVVDTQCDPIPWTWVDVWHADTVGDYDNSAPFIYRGHGFTNAFGEFTLTTIIPGLYPGRTRHIHIKVDADNTNVLTTQIYFPGVPQNATDGLYNPTLQVTAISGSVTTGLVAEYEFHLVKFEPSCASDFDNDDVVDASDLAVVLGAWGTQDADLTGDGITDAADLSVLLGEWGSCS